MNRLLIAAALVASTASVSAQHALPCYTTEMYANTRFNTSGSPATEANKGNRAVFRIPVVVHVIHDGVPESPIVIDDATLPEDNIPDSVVFKQLNITNADFNRENPDAVFTLTEFQGVAGSAELRFELAVRDPDGNPTNGIDRVLYPGISHAGYFTNVEIETVIKPLTVWDPENYLNIWVMRFTESTSQFALLGYAQFPDSTGLDGMPSDSESQSAATDGIVVNTAVFGRTGAEDVFNNSARTVTHELGHSFGLRHIWGDGDCTEDDFVEDTPEAEAASAGCNLSQSSCGGLNMVQNYMDYSQGACQNLFTKGQVARINEVMIKSPRRRTLPNSPALSGTTSTNTINSADRIRCYPNPVSTVLYVHTISPLAQKAEIWNMIGQKILETELNSNLTTISTESLPKGIYFLRTGTGVQRFEKL